MFGFKGIHHIAVSVPSLVEAKIFYIDKLGFTVIDSQHFSPSKMGDDLLQLEHADCHMMMIKAGNIILEVFEFHQPIAKTQDSPRPLCDHGYTHLSFEVEDIQIAYEHLKKSGVTWHHSPTEVSEGYMMTYGRDPFGNVIEIQQLQSGYPFSFDQLGV